LPFTVKDWIETEGLPGTAGDLRFKDFRAKADAPVVARIRAAGALLLGKTNMAPWGGDWTSHNPVFGRSNNPWDLDRTPGGSTGGGAAALAAGLSPLELGNDIGGSVRVPAAFSGVYGHRPSETLWPRTGQTPDPSGQHLPNPATGLGVGGPMARSAEDLELALELAAGPDVGEDVAWRLELPSARHSHLNAFRVAVLPRMSWLPVEEEIWAALERLADGLRRLGATVKEAQPAGYDDGLEFHKLYYSLLIQQTSRGIPAEMRPEIAKWLEKKGTERSDPILEAGGKAFLATAMDYMGYWLKRERYRAAYREFFRQWDVLLTPITLVPAFRHDQAPLDVEIDDRTLTIGGQVIPYTRQSVYPGLATLCGHPATVFPFGQTQSHLPIGLQAIGPYLEDRTPLRFAQQVAKEFGGFQPPAGYDA
jgi:amidase